MATVTITLEVRGEADDARTVVRRLLDVGSLQESINSHSFDAGPLTVLDARCSVVESTPAEDSPTDEDWEDYDASGEDYEPMARDFENEDTEEG